MPMTDADKKALQAKFNAEFLTMSNSLGGNPVALLRSEDAEKLIMVAGRALKQMCEIAYAYHYHQPDNEQSDNGDDSTQGDNPDVNHQPDDEQSDSITDTDDGDDSTQDENPDVTE